MRTWPGLSSLYNHSRCFDLKVVLQQAANHLWESFPHNSILPVALATEMPFSTLHTAWCTDHWYAYFHLGHCLLHWPLRCLSPHCTLPGALTTEMPFSTLHTACCTDHWDAFLHLGHCLLQWPMSSQRFAIVQLCMAEATAVASLEYILEL